MIALGNEGAEGPRQDEVNPKYPYFRFASYFVDNASNLKNIMMQIGALTDDEERIKEELFLLLSFFILTFENRKPKI